MRPRHGSAFPPFLALPRPLVPPAPPATPFSLPAFLSAKRKARNTSWKEVEVGWLFWTVLSVLRGTVLEVMNMMDIQSPYGCPQSLVPVYCFAPGRKLPSVMDLCRSHHWKKNPADNDYLPVVLSCHHPNSSPSRSSPVGRRGG